MLPWIIFRTGANLKQLDSEANNFDRKEKIGISIALSMAVLCVLPRETSCETPANSSSAGITSFLKIYAIIRVNMPNAQPGKPYASYQ
jgi:hypothetical protein